MRGSKYNRNMQYIRMQQLDPYLNVYSLCAAYNYTCA